MRILGKIRYNNQRRKQRKHYADELRKMEERKNGIIPPEFQSLQQLQNRHQGKTCYIVSSPYALTEEDRIAMKQGFSIGINDSLVQNNRGFWTPDYLGIQNPAQLHTVESELQRMTDVPLLAGDNLEGHLSKLPQAVEYPYLGVYKYFDNEYGQYSTRFSGNALEVVYDGYSVAYSMLQLAVYMGAKKIVLIGCGDEGNPRLQSAYAAAQRYVEERGIALTIR